MRDDPHRASVLGAGSFGTAVAVVLARAGVRVTLVCRTREQARRLGNQRENSVYLPGVELPDRVRVRALDALDRHFDRADLVLVVVPSSGAGEALAELTRRGVAHRAAVASLTKGLLAPEGSSPMAALERAFGQASVACVGGPAHAREMVESGAGLISASTSPELARTIAELFRRGGIVCEESTDPFGVELAGCAKNAAALATGATVGQGLNAAGMAAADIFTEVLALAERRGGRARTFVGRAGTGDLVATALAQSSRNRTAGELLATGVPAAEIPERLGHAVEALVTVPLLAHAIERAGLAAPITSALARLIDGSLPLEEWVRVVRVSQPQPERRARFRDAVRRRLVGLRRRLRPAASRATRSAP